MHVQFNQSQMFRCSGLFRFGTIRTWVKCSGLFRGVYIPRNTGTTPEPDLSRNQKASRKEKVSGGSR